MSFLFLTKQQLERLKFRLITFKTFQPMGPGLDSLLHQITRPTLHPTTLQLAKTTPIEPKLQFEPVLYLLPVF